MVRVVGIEPTLLAEPDFESGASTSSTTPAHGAADGCIKRRWAVLYKSLQQNARWIFIAMQAIGAKFELRPLFVDAVSTFR